MKLTKSDLRFLLLAIAFMCAIGCHTERRATATKHEPAGVDYLPNEIGWDNWGTPLIYDSLIYKRRGDGIKFVPNGLGRIFWDYQIVDTVCSHLYVYLQPDTIKISHDHEWFIKSSSLNKGIYTHTFFCRTCKKVDSVVTTKKWINASQYLDGWEVVGEIRPLVCIKCYKQINQTVIEEK